jgi:ABC-2 type transport system permease protein
MGKYLGPIIYKEFYQIIRDPRSLFASIAIPFMLLLLFGYSISFDIRDIKLAVVDHSMSMESRNFISSLTSGGYFTLYSMESREEELDRLIEQGRARIGIIIPPDFAMSLKANKPTSVLAIIDGLEANFAGVALGYFMAGCQNYSLNIGFKALEKRGMKSLLASYPPIKLESRFWYNQELTSQNFVVPGIIPMIIMMIAVLITSLAVAKEYERGTMEQLVVSRIHPLELMVGKLVPYIGIGIIQVTIVVLVGMGLFGVPFRGSVAAFAILTFIFLVGCLAVGLFFSVVTKSQQVAMQLSVLSTQLPSMLLSGIFFPVDSMPFILRMLSYLVPAKYFVVALRGIMLKGVGMRLLATEAMMLTFISVVLILLCAKNFKKTLD